MVRTLNIVGLTLGLSAMALVLVAGCNSGDATNAPRSEKPAEAAPAPVAAAPAAPPAEHAHKPGAHNGAIVEIGRDSYHAEAVFEKGGGVRLYTLGQDEGKVQEVEAQTLTAYVKPDGGTDATPMELKAAPQPGDSEGKTSLFAGQVPAALQDQRLEVAVPSIRIGADRFRFSFKNYGEDAHSEGMPAKVADEDERKLYLTPGGKYTEADVKANGNITASQKFKGQMASHDLKPKSGDRICPITLTKANPKFTWVVGGKTYEFCCPPCVDEFVKAAKEDPASIKEPEDYVKKK